MMYWLAVASFWIMQQSETMPMKNGGRVKYRWDRLIEDDSTPIRMPSPERDFGIPHCSRFILAQNRQDKHGNARAH